MNQLCSKQELNVLFLLSILFLSLIGCGESGFPPDMPQPYPATVTVTQDDQPLADASVVLVPMDPTNTWYAGGTTDATGKAVLQTHAKYNGVVPGKYFIIVSKFEPTKVEGKAAIDPETDPEGYAKAMSAGGDVRTGSGGFDLVDPKFGKASPGITIEVTAGGANEQTVDVGKAVRVERKT